MLVLHALGLVVDLLGSRLVLVGLETTLGLVTSVGEGLLGLLLVRLRRVRSELLLGLYSSC